MKNPLELLSLVKFHFQIERRKSLRVSARRNYSFFPIFSFDGLPLEVEDVSVTGVCFKNFFDQKLPDTHLDLEVCIDKTIFKCRYQIVEQNSRILRVMHAEFEPKFTLKLDQSLRAGQIGVLFRKSATAKNESWKGPVGEKVNFKPSANVLASISIFDLNFECTIDGKFVFEESNRHLQLYKGQLVTGYLLERLHFALDNITSPTPMISRLIHLASNQLDLVKEQLKAVS